MRINRVVLENYGLYSGRNEIDLVPRGRGPGKAARPIILIGGMNGAGKTTLLDAVRLALYGKSAVGDRISEKWYQDHLLGLVHRSRTSLVQFDYARVGVEFDLVLRGKRETYYVQRCWNQRSGNGVEESLQVYRRDETSRDGDYNSWPTLVDLEPEHWQTFVNDVVPDRLSQLFFFDGEKIKRIADDISGDAAIAEAIRSLLGLDTVERLKADLSILATREAKEHLKADESATLEAVEDETARIEKELAALEQARAELETAIHGVEDDIKRLETQLQEQGGLFAQNRPEKLARQTALETEIQNLKRQVRQECEGLFPLSLCPKVARLLEANIRTETQFRQRETAREGIVALENRLVDNLSSALVANGRTVKATAIRIVRKTVAEHLGDGSPNEHAPLGFSESDASQVLDWMRDARENAARAMQRICGELEHKERETQKIRQELNKAPDELVLAPVFGDLSAQNQILGQKRAEMKTLDERASALRNGLEAKEREKRHIEERAQMTAGVRGRLALIGNVQKALDKYLTRLTAMKVETLRQTVTDCFNRLSRKGDLLHDISINARTFEVTLSDKTGHTIPREELSAGEKQILAISILWGLAQTSGRPLPVIIDTPLGRLDSDHRMNLIRNYFPHAAHQVILLSTDTEVDKPLFLELKPYVSHCYHLVYDKEERRTYPRQEYFWKEQLHA